MDENTKNNNTSKLNLIATPFLFCVFVGVVLYVNGLGIKNIMKLGWLTIVIIAIMFAILLWDAFIARSRLINITDSLNAYANKEDFNNDFITNCIEKYNTAKQAYKNLGHSISIDISDYINEQTIAEYTHKDICDQISNAMTGLGILGTFIGLTMGLEKFNSQDAILSTPLLLEGIKVAFYSSVFGVMASLLHNYFYHAELERSALALETFYDSFYKPSSMPSDLKFYNEMIKYSKEQNKNISKMAGAIGDEMVKKFDYAIQKSINNYIVEAVNSQSASLRQIVESFMKQLNNALDDQFHNLSRSINEMCKWQDESTQNLKSIMGSLNKITDDMSKLTIDTNEAEEKRKAINERSHEIFDQMKRHADAFKDYTEFLHNWTEELKSFTGNDNIINQFSEIIAGQNEEKKLLIEKFDVILQKVEVYRKQIDQITEANKEENNLLINEIKTLINNIENFNNNSKSEYQKNIKLVSDSLDNIEANQKYGYEQLINKTQNLVEEIKRNNNNSFFGMFAKSSKFNHNDQRDNEK